MFRKTASIFAAALLACAAFTVNAAGFDGKTLVTNAWFNASFTALTVGTDIATNTATGITRGAGSWTSAPTNGTAKIVADGEATKLSIDAPDEELTFTPAALAPATGMETMSIEVNTIPVAELPEPEGGAQGAFAIYSTNGVDHSLAAYVSDGTSAVWTNLVYASAADLTNVWFTLTMDFATVSNVRYVRYSITPPAGSLTVLADTEGTQWFRSADSAATTVQSVSFTGTGNIRTFSGDSLAEAVANYNGVNYETVADAIAAADEGGTVTIVKTVTEGTLTISKNLTLDFNGKAAALGGIVISEGKTLTVTRANSNSNVIPTITGGGSLVVSGNNTFAWKGMAGTSSLASITQESSSGGITISGYGTINVTSNVIVNAILTFTPSAIISDTVNDEYTIKLSAKSLTAQTLNGGATIETTDCATVSSGTFYGKFTGAGALNASGGFVLQGVEAFAGKFNVKSGTVSVATRNPSAGWRLDASDTSNMTITDGKLVSFTTPYGNNTRTWTSSGADYIDVGTDEDYFDGKQVMFFNANAEYEYTSGNLRYGTCFAVYQKNENLTSDEENVLLTSRNYPDKYKLRFGIYKNGYQDRATWYAWNNGTGNNPNYIWPIYLDGSNTLKKYTAGKKSVLSFAAAFPAASSNGIQLGKNGTTFIGAVAEIVGLDNAVSLEERSAIEYYLMKKWDCTDVGNFAQLAATTEVTVDSGATLDLGGYDHTVASFTGAGMVTNGRLVTTDNVYTNVGALSISAVDDMTIVLDAGATALTLVGDATNVSVTATDAFIESGAEITITASAIHTAGHTIDFSGIPSNIFRFGYNDNGDGTWTLGAQTSGFTAATYVWSPTGGNTNWTSIANWKVGGKAVAVLPQSIDTVQFPSSEEDEFMGWSVVLGSRQTIAALVANTNVAISGAQICSPSYTGDGKLSLGDGAGFYVDDHTTIANDLEIVGSVSVTPSATYLTTYINGNLTGAGTLTLEGTRPTHVLSGDNSGFKGVVVAPKDSSDRNNVYLSSETAASEAAEWRVNSSGVGNFLHLDNTTVKFGSLNGSIYFSSMDYAKNVLEIGALNKDMSLSGSFCYAEGQDQKGNWRVRNSGNDIRKVGSGNLTLAANRVRNVYLANGVVTLAHGTNSVHRETRYIFEGGTMAITGRYDDGETVDFSDPSPLIVDSASPIAFSNAVNEVHAWATSLPDTNTGGLVKKGEGTLILKDIPYYTGDTYLEGGKLKIPASAGVRVKTTIEGKSVYRDSETIEGEEYTVYSLGKKRPLVFVIY